MTSCSLSSLPSAVASIQNRIAIITDDPGWHGARLREALAIRGFQYRYVSLTSCRLQLDSGGLPILLPGFEQKLPEGVFVRGVPGGGLEQVTLYLGILHGLKRLGIPVYNDAGAIERTVDKGMTSFILHTHGIPTPRTWVTSDRLDAIATVQSEIAQGHAIVFKPLFGSQGQGIQLLRTVDDLQNWDEPINVFYLQRFVDCGTESHDFRIFVINGHAVAGMKRCGSTWLNNVHQGARCEPLELNGQDELTRLAEAAVRVLGMDYAGVDIIREREGHYSVLEVNSIPAWKGLQTVTSASIADSLVEDFLGRYLAQGEAA